MKAHSARPPIRKAYSIGCRVPAVAGARSMWKRIQARLVHGSTTVGAPSLGLVWVRSLVIPDRISSSRTRRGSLSGWCDLGAVARVTQARLCPRTRARKTFIGRGLAPRIEAFAASAVLSISWPRDGGGPRRLRNSSPGVSKCGFRVRFGPPLSRRSISLRIVLLIPFGVATCAWIGGRADSERRKTG